MSENKWVMHRAGLINFWYYSDEEYHFANGKLLLRGLNGSGKSVTMQSLITVLLDGKITANRLDPFGSKDRRMEDYLLGEKDIIDRDERTGYLYLEYKRENSDQYLTTGVGLKARRGGSLDFWGFVVTDNRRIKQELQLLKTEFSAVDGQEERIPLTRPELERLIGPQGGFVVRSQGEYAALVNKYVFGFATVDAYKDLMELLIQLRSPKLSKDFKPSVIHEILTNSLPSLSDEELRPLADTIENMEQTKQQIAELLRDQAALARLSRQYREYNAAVLAEKAREVVQSGKSRHKVEQAYLEKSKERQIKTQELIQQQEQRLVYERETEVLTRQKEELDSHDVFKAEVRKQNVEETIRVIQQKQQDKAAALAGKQQIEIREKSLLTREEEQLDQAETQMLEVLDELSALAAENCFTEHDALAGSFEKNYAGDYSFRQWKQEQSTHQRRLEDILAKIRSHIAAKREQHEAAVSAEAAQLAFDSVREAARKAEQEFFDNRQEILAALYQWITACREVLPLEAGTISRVAGAVQQLYEGADWRSVKEPVEQAYKQQEDCWRRQALELAVQEQQKQAERQILTTELAGWKTKKEPEPPRHPELVATRNRLVEAGIPFAPFYAAVEFRAGVPAGERERIEAVLGEIGLLDALIVPRESLKKLPDGMIDRVIYPEPAILSATLADYLEPTPPATGTVRASDIDEVLRSIIVNEVEPAGLTAAGAITPVVSVQCGTYRSGIVAGRAPTQATALYIGQEARRRHREQEMVKLEAAIAAIDDVLRGLAAEQTAVREEIIALAAVLDLFPQAQPVEAAYNRWQDKLRESRVEEENARRKNVLLREIMNKVQVIMNQLRQVSAGLQLPLGEEAYVAACRQAAAYREELYKLELARQTYLHSLKNTEQTKLRLVEAMDDVNALKGECLVLAGELAKYELEYQHLLALLVEMGAADIRRRSGEIIRRLAELPSQMENTIEAMAQCKAALSELDRQLAGLEEERIFSQQIHDCWREIYAGEAALRLTDEQRDGEGELPEPLAVISRYDPASLADLDRPKLAERLNESYYREQAVLVEYRLELNDLFTEEVAVPELPPAGDNESYQRRVSLLKQVARRKQVTLEYDGRRVSPPAALALIEQHIAEQQAVLSEQDRELYEEVIMNSIGRLISRRINSAEKWVAQMNDLMESLDTSSGLAFSLQWKPHTADHDDQLDTQELVSLLRADHRLLKEEDIKRVVRHFQSRIEQAKAQAAARTASFQQVVKEMLDFRQWFAFTLYYRREGLPKKELTNNVFGKFSGGEKAMAMYTPLFSAAYSRYREAKPDAPHVISLDEAFAGVDENNIREMFDLVEKMGFNYIINSQALWGDYDTVQQLSICELVRPKNAPFVTVVRYLWDGNCRRLLYNEVS
ncbi:TIGR02680 family protein [Sporomusa termitida]|uniref:TIGR02680: family protein n=1 Tax=Sporomusa termitida TaxID=2377 RepID=A0A517DRF0_9FIRM|nr:TIGR02680 family protein [Sporomusa termitida]QDR79940.1 TIGR02680: family protein [Sporomusa termitida]